MSEGSLTAKIVAGYVDHFDVENESGGVDTYEFRPSNYADVEAAKNAANTAAGNANALAAACKTAASSANQAAASCVSAASSAGANSAAANKAASAANSAASAANQAAAKAKPYYFQAAEPTREQRVNGMLWLHTNEAAHTAVAKRWDAGLVGNAIFPGSNTFPQASAYPDIMGGWTTFSI